MTRKIAEWISDPVNVALAVTYATAVMQAVYSETKWRWAGIVANVLASLPGVNIKGIMTAGRNAPKVVGQ